jgi:hypothetical protein
MGTICLYMSHIFAAKRGKNVRVKHSRSCCLFDLQRTFRLVHPRFNRRRISAYRDSCELAREETHTVSGLSKKQWAFLSKTLLRAGFVLVGFVFFSLLILNVYFVDRRPQFPQPEYGWTIRLNVSPGGPRYGSAEDYLRQERLAFSFLASFIIPAAGAAIQKLKLDD